MVLSSLFVCLFFVVVLFSFCFLLFVFCCFVCLFCLFVCLFQILWSKELADAVFSNRNLEDKTPLKLAVEKGHVK